MSNALIDALLPVSKPSRTAEPAAPRASEQGQDFAPVLNKALDARPAEASAPSRDDRDDRDDWQAEDASIAPAQGQAAESGDADARQDDAVDVAAENADHADAAEGDAEQVDEDAVEISAEAEAAAAAAVVATVATTATEKPHAEHATADAEVAEIQATENAAAKPDAKSPLPKPAPDVPDAGSEAVEDAAAAETDANATPVENSADNAATANLSRQASPKEVHPSHRRTAAETAHDATATAEAAKAPAAATQVAASAQKPAPKGKPEASKDEPTEAAAKSAEDTDSTEGRTDKSATIDAPIETDSAVDSLQTVEASGDYAPDATPAATNTPVAAPVAHHHPAESGRSSVHTAISRLAGEWSLHTPAESAGDGTIDRGRFVGRVEGAIRAAQQRDGRVQVRLSPPELGALRIELTIQQGSLAARLEAETPAARNLLLDNLPALRERLAQQDIRVERFDVDLRQDSNGGGGSPQQGAMQERQPRDADWRQTQTRPDRGRGLATPSAGPLRSSNHSPSTDSGLDVRV